MDYYSILDNNPQAGLEPVLPNLVSSQLPPANPIASNLESKTEAAPIAREGLRFPGEDGGKSLSEMAQRDLDATLQLLAERAQYITGASGAAVALRDGESMVCCASAGPSAPELGAHLQIDSGLSAESVRTRQILICEDAENDPRVNRESCRTFGIASVVVMPLVRGEEVYGVFELLSGRPRAFEERDYVALNRLSEMIQTAVEHADAARRAETELGQMGLGQMGMTPAVIAGPAPVPAAAEVLDTVSEQPAPEAAIELKTITTPPITISAPESTSVLTAKLEPETVPGLAADLASPAEADLSAPISTIAFGNLRRCETCGFPVSEGRRLCLDCEAATPGAVASVDIGPQFSGGLDEPNTSWVRSHAYLIATALVAAATIVLLVWRL